ncbi:hypothetical protein A3Q56_01337 [Intoshia linei]|uniref:Mannosyltransferase n=1 Tax=Intoshia linei TaxID=1819745 RepID=A0A177BBL3_9BILA|nr:hypothetical protein A3Q56_01337 [Intoshia linei]
MFGEHSPYWYLFVGIPVVFTTMTPLLVYTIYKRLFKSVIPISTILTICVYSGISHKEYRFIYALLPLLIPEMSNSLYINKFFKRNLIRFLYATFIVNLITIIFAGIIHQRGSLDANRFLMNSKIKNPRIFFLMQCYSNTGYSHYHYTRTENVDRNRLKYLYCDIFNVDNNESRKFNENPIKYISNMNLSNYDYILFFSKTAEPLSIFSIINELHSINYKKLKQKTKNFLKILTNHNFVFHKRIYHSYFYEQDHGNFIDIFIKLN